MPIKHNPDTQKFTTTRTGHNGELGYTRPAEGIIDFTHTFVEEALRGQGVAEELAHAGLVFARESRLKVKNNLRVHGRLCEAPSGRIR